MWWGNGKSWCRMESVAAGNVSVGLGEMEWNQLEWSRVNCSWE